MRRNRTYAICTTALIGFASAPSAAGDPGSWKCEKPAVLDPRANAGLEAISTKPSLRNIALEYMKRWDAKHMRASCEAFAFDQPTDISCLHGRRDWQAIKNSIPNDLFGMSALDQRDHLLKIQSEGDGLEEAQAFCKSAGATTEPALRFRFGDDS